MDTKITFTDLVDKIAEETGASKRVVHDFLIETGHLTREKLGEDGRVNLRGLGRFRLKWYEARSGRNPQTGEEIEIPAHSRVKFKAEGELREYINRKYAHLRPKTIKTDTELAEPEPRDDSFHLEDKFPPPPPITPASKKKKDKKRHIRWLWIVILLLILILAYLLLWPYLKSLGTRGTEPAIPEKITPVTPSQPEEISPEEEPIAEELKAGIPGGQHTVHPGENLWTISRDFYNQAELWPNIYRVNLNQMNNPDLLLIGNEVQIPSLLGKPGNLMKKDIEEIAEGYIEVYLVYKNSDKEKAQYYLWVVQKLNADEVINRFKDRIDEVDLKWASKIKGYPCIK